jgi:hypothetical protein
MIAFDLECSKGHQFEGWFNSLQSFEEQKAKKLISCPQCHDTKIKKVLSPVAMKTSSSAERDEGAAFSVDDHFLAAKIIDYIHKNFDDVGPNFTKEALKIHHGVAEKRNIKGSATTEEENILKDEGVEFFKIPVPKGDEEKKN